MLTFAMIKPHIVKNPWALSQIMRIIDENNFTIVKKSRVKFNLKSAKQFYSEHEGRFYYNRLVTFMSRWVANTASSASLLKTFYFSGPSEVLILERDNAITAWRELLGPTKVLKAIYSHPDSIRGLFGLTDTRNACHGSDSPESVAQEIQKVFPDFDLKTAASGSWDGGTKISLIRLNKNVEPVNM